MTTLPSEQATASRRVELYLRGDTYGTYDRQQAILERVRGLESDGVVDETSVDASWQRIRTPEQDSRDGALATYEEFGEWAQRNGYRLEPAFERRHRGYMGTDTVREVVVFPLASLAVYEDEKLRSVFPCSEESGTVHFTVADALDAFEAGDDDWFEQFDVVSVDRTEPLLDPART
jgi:hypothetical protein